MARQLRHWLEYGGVRLALVLLEHLPPASARGLLGSAASLFYALNTSRSRIARENIRLCELTRDPREIDRIARASFRHLAMVVAESIQARRVLTQDTWESHVNITIAPEARRLLKDPAQGILLTSGHLGNWELGSRLVAYMKPVLAVARDMKNPHVDKLMKDRDARSGIRVVPKRGATARCFLDVLKNGQMLALMIDQYARDHRMMIPFFGRPTATHVTPAVLHLATGAPIIFGYLLRQGPMDFHLVLNEVIVHPRTGNRDNDVREILTRLNKAMEDAISRNPEQYLWAHRRWKEKDLEQADTRSTGSR